MNTPSPSPAAAARPLVGKTLESRGPAVAKRLDPREEEFVRLLSKGLLYKEIRERMGISNGILRKLQRRAYRKLRAQNRTEAVNAWWGARR